MKTIGLLGGMSWESTIQYYRLINEQVKVRLGGLHSAKIVLASLDFHEIAELQRTDNWDDAGRLLTRHARGLQSAGAEIVLICTNTMHKVAPTVAAGLAIPLLHVADATAAVVVQSGCRRPGLLGTRFTMEESFYRERLGAERHLQVLIPDPDDRAIIHRIIYEELCLGRLLPQSREEFQRIIGKLTAAGADSVILGCTEISLLVGPADAPVPLFDTTAIHSRAAVAWALGEASESLPEKF